jgi:membrane protein DedA with SNARE-associated domain
VKRIGFVAALAITALALVATGTVQLPDLEHALTELSETLGTWTYALVGGLAFLETVAVLLIAWVAAAVGDIASFVLGARLGRRFIHRHGTRLGMTAPRVDRVEQFYARHGAKAILVGRFVGIIRAVSPFLAGSSGLRFRAFLPWSLLGTLVWASAFTLVGYAFSESFSQATGALTHGAFALALVAAVLLAVRAHRRAAHSN